VSGSVRLLAAAGLAAWLGSTLLLAELRWFRRTSLTDRLAPYAPGALRRRRRSGAGAGTAGTFREVVAPLAQSVGDRVAALFGVHDQLDVRLRRFHSPLDVATFRTRQLGWVVAASGAAALITLSVELPPLLALLLLLGAPLLTFLVLEQQAMSASARWQRRVFLELPIIAEQLGMLLAAGYSLGAALNRLAQRSHGACATDLALVCGRIRQGLSEVAALREWSDLVQVDALDRLVAVLALNAEASDLGTLVAEEARTIRADAHRELLETIERRSQQVWIPVTVATLVPGVLFMAVPFIEAMRLFTEA
jgi:Flp pilus assembly protein TadB